MLAHRCSIGFLSCWSKNISYSSKGIYGRVAGCGSSPLSPARERTSGNWVFVECRAIGEGSSPWVCQGEEKENGQLVWSSVPLVKHRGCLGCFFLYCLSVMKSQFWKHIKSCPEIYYMPENPTDLAGNLQSCVGGQQVHFCELIALFSFEVDSWTTR